MLDEISQEKQILKSSAVIMFFKVLGLASALFLDVLIAARFGLGTHTDAFFVAFAIPQLTAAILFMVCNSVLVPVFTEGLTSEGKGDPWRLFSVVANSSTLLLSAIALGGIALSPLVIALTAPGLESSTAQLAMSLNRPLFLFIVPIALVEVMKAMLNAHHRFAAPASAQFIQYAVAALIVLVLAPTMGIASVALGYLASTPCQLLILAVALRRVGGKYYPLLDFNYPGVKTIGKLAVPRLTTAALTNGNILLERFLGSFLPVGAVSALVYARRILRAMSSIFLDSVSVALLPRLSARFAQSDLPGLKRFTTLGVRLISFLAVPVTTGIIALNVPLVRLLYQRGAFDEGATLLTASILSFYILSLIPASVRQIIFSTYFAMQDTLTPLLLRAIELTLNILLDVALLGMMGAPGLALGFALSACLALIVNLWRLRHRIGALEYPWKPYLLKVGGSAAIMGGVVFLLRRWAARTLASSLVAHLSILALELLVGLAVYGLLTSLMKVEEMGYLIKSVKDRLSPRRT
jgi:putative peptidoglycan lipid II flippase